MTTIARTTTATTVGPARPTVWKHGLGISVVASLVTTAAAAVASAAGVSFAGPDGTSIPLTGFTQMTFIFSMVGVALAAALARKACRPRRTFVRTTSVLTALSLVPDATFGFDPASAVSLMTLHLIAAAIVIPVIAHRLNQSR